MFRYRWGQVRPNDRLQMAAANPGLACRKRPHRTDVGRRRAKQALAGGLSHPWITAGLPAIAWPAPVKKVAAGVLGPWPGRSFPRRLFPAMHRRTGKLLDTAAAAGAELDDARRQPSTRVRERWVSRPRWRHDGRRMAKHDARRRAWENQGSRQSAGRLSINPQLEEDELQFSTKGTGGNRHMGFLVEVRASCDTDRDGGWWMVKRATGGLVSSANIL